MAISTGRAVLLSFFAFLAVASATYLVLQYSGGLPPPAATPLPQPLPPDGPIVYQQPYGGGMLLLGPALLALAILVGVAVFWLAVRRSARQFRVECRLRIVESLSPALDELYFAATAGDRRRFERAAAGVAMRGKLLTGGWPSATQEAFERFLHLARQHRRERIGEDGEDHKVGIAFSEFVDRLLDELPRP